MKSNDTGTQTAGTNRDFAEALVFIAKLPLNNAEKAEAVRRLLAGKVVANNAETNSNP